MEAFSRSSREEDDEEALKWAALEKLPTYNRLRKGLLTASHGVANEIDVSDLGFQQKQKLLERLVKVAEEDNERFLLKLRERIDRYISSSSQPLLPYSMHHLSDTDTVMILHNKHRRYNLENVDTYLYYIIMNYIN